MTSREAIIAVVDTLVWIGAGIAIVYVLVLSICGLFRRYVHINGKKATLRDEPLGFTLVLVAFAGVIYFLWPVFWGGAQASLR